MSNLPSGHPEGVGNIMNTKQPAARKGPEKLPAWLQNWGPLEGSPNATPLLHDVIRSTAVHSPDATAVEQDGTKITYADLNLWSDQLAGHLQSLSVGPESMVALSFDQPLDALIAMLGVLKAGAAYSSLDPLLPEALWQKRLEACDCQLLITNADLLPDLPEVPIRQLCLDAAWEIITKTACFDVQEPVHGENLACATYFCGTHPLTQGVQMPHRALYHLTCASCIAYDLRPTDRVLQVSPLETVFAAAEIFPAWLSGAALITTSAWFSSLDDILQTLDSQSITVAHLPNDAWLDLIRRLEETELQLPDHLRLIVVGEEAVSPQHLQLWQERFAGKVNLQTTYGTNGTQPAAERPARSAAAAPDVRSYLLNADLEPVEAGEVGELFIAGSGLGRGYFRQPAETANHFLPDPMSASGRMYRTGHQARLQPDGTVEFLGHQARDLRGFRIDLGEGHAAYREPTAVEAVVFTPGEVSHRLTSAEREMLKRLQHSTGGCIQSSMTAYQMLSTSDLLAKFVEERFRRLSPGQEVH